MTGTSSARAEDRLPPATRYALAASTLGTGMVYLDQSAVNVALPALRTGLDIVVSDLQWVMSLYVLFASAPLLVCGILGDRFGRVRFYVAGMSLFGVASTACALAPGLEVLLVARSLQGLGAAMMVAVGLAILNANTPRAVRGRVIGLWASLTSLVVAIGPAAGGVLVDAASWRLVFAINAPLALLAIVLAWRKLPESRGGDERGVIDSASVLLMLAGMGSLLFGLIEGPRLDWSAAPVGGLVCGVALMILFVARQRTTVAPLVPAHLFRHRVFAGINAVTLLQWIAISAVFFFLPINLQQVQGYSATVSGLSILPVSFAVLVLSRISGRLADRLGALPLITAGIALIALALTWFAHMTRIESYAADLLPGTLAFGCGLGLLIAPLTHVAMNALPDRHSGLASGVNNTASRLANMISVALLGSLMVTGFAAGLDERISLLPITAETASAITAQSENLGALEPPAGMAPALAERVRDAAGAAFFDAWRQVMLLAVFLCGLSLALAWLALRPPPT